MALFLYHLNYWVLLFLYYLKLQHFPIVPYQLIMSLVDAFPKKFRNVVNIGSIYGSVVPNANLYKNFHKDSSIQYGVTKAALQQLTKD